jgi:hypothetical protein
VETRASGQASDRADHQSAEHHLSKQRGQAQGGQHQNSIDGPRCPFAGKGKDNDKEKARREAYRFSPVDSCFRLTMPFTWVTLKILLIDI